MAQESEGNAALIAQLAQLNNRVNIYATRMWQLPFAYLAIVCIAIASFKSANVNHVYVVATILFSAGVIVLNIIRNHNNRISTLIKFVHTIENQLNLEESMEEQRALPYYIIVSLCMLSPVVGAYLK